MYLAVVYENFYKMLKIMQLLPKTLLNQSNRPSDNN